MPYYLILVGIVVFNAVQSHESDSVEAANRIEVSPVYDTIIFSDVADIINEFENNLVNNPLEALANSASESDENIEDLLSEYQHYLEKAHKQRMNYLEKNKAKNKVPLIRHERFTKTKPAMGAKYDANYYSNSYYNPNKLPLPQYQSPLDVFMPINSKMRYFPKPEASTPQPIGGDVVAFDKRLIELPTGINKLRHEPLKPPCVCKNGQYPCDCKCKQCVVPYDNIPQNYYQHNTDPKSFPQTSELVSEDRIRDSSENNLNIRIKVDIQLPKVQEAVGKVMRNRSRDDDYNSEAATSAVNLPFPYFNFPIPMDLFGYRRTLSKFNKHDTSPMHKITIHKKKKSRSNNSNKKHRKKVITFHNLSIEPQIPVKMQTFIDEAMNVSNPTFDLGNQTGFILNLDKIEVNITHDQVLNKTEDPLSMNETQTEENIIYNYTYVNVTNNNENVTEENRKIENSVETEYQKPEIIIPKEKVVVTQRKKREVNVTTSKPELTRTTESQTEKGTSPTPTVFEKTRTTPDNNADMLVKPLEMKKTDKILFADTELLYWPNNTRNFTVVSRNITTIILDRENNKAKLNMTKETIRHNHTKVLEKAIFGDVNWDDVDTVAPVFMSFVGKYITGVLTFCSQNVCHSMKCAEKACVHRTCAPQDRWNLKGHCAGCNTTDSVASLESIMDLPSNIAFEIVDILQDKMLGKLFGKVTLCISTKCISFVASKKNFIKSKCLNKELNKAGHCPSVKNFKIM